MGGFGGQQAKAPEIDYGASKRLTEDDLKLRLEYLPKFSEGAGKASRREYTDNLQFGLGILEDRTLRQRYEQAFPEEAARRASLLNRIEASGATTAELNRLQQALGAGTPARTTQAAMMEAARMRPVREVQGVNAQRVADVRARNVGAGALGGSLLAEAQRRVESGGRLSAEASRDAVQAARAGMAARGMATGNAGLAAELLNRDRFARARNMEDLGFAQGVQNADVQRRMSNAELALQAARGNQALAGQMSLADQAAMMDAQRLNQARDMSIGQTDAQLAQDAAARNAASQNQANIFNAEMLAQNDRNNVAMLGQSALLADQERVRQLALGQDAYNFGLASNPQMMAIGAGSPYANMTAPAMEMVSGARGFQPVYSGGQFSSGGIGGGLVGGAMGAAGGALSGAAMGTMIGPGWGTALGAGLGALGGLTGFMGGSR